MPPTIRPGTGGAECYGSVAILHSQDLLAERVFVDLVLTKHLKKAEIWLYRKWLFDLLRDRVDISLSTLLDHELAVCSQTSTEYLRNYYSWSHRISLVPLFDNHRLQNELTWSLKFSRSHLADRCCLHYREQLWLAATLLSARSDPSSARIDADERTLTSLGDRLQRGQLFDLRCSPALSESLFEAFEQTTQLCELYAGHEGLWYHRRFLLALLCSVALSGSSGDGKHSSAGATPSSSLTPAALLAEEVDRCVAALDDQRLVNIRLPAQHEFASDHLLWLLRWTAASRVSACDRSNSEPDETAAGHRASKELGATRLLDSSHRENLEHTLKVYLQCAGVVRSRR
eukprot:CAMPEP_0177636092 /NCGR_PEP_ID=MMETSP0447-20121125/4251_1 /TAXON_ID=0 /ORGANISM="Stygamoeba regulata, Strain BSH-02190019" /LENGTH=343 /DNA_ID=CAMNT_0019137925 /DNA_START=547 /DNA_END=1574 /DNA_ORIENTATION=-